MYKIIEIPNYQASARDLEIKINNMKLEGYELKFVSDRFLYFEKQDSKSEVKRKNVVK